MKQSIAEILADADFFAKQATFIEQCHAQASLGMPKTWNALIACKYIQSGILGDAKMFRELALVASSIADEIAAQNEMLVGPAVDSIIRSKVF